MPLSYLKKTSQRQRAFVEFNVGKIFKTSETNKSYNTIVKPLSLPADN